MTESELAAFEKACGIAGSQTALAKKLSLSKGAVSQWKDRQVPAEHCPAIERMVNREVTCEQLRPDVDWAFIRESSAAPKQANRRKTD